MVILVICQEFYKERLCFTIILYVFLTESESEQIELFIGAGDDSPQTLLPGIITKRYFILCGSYFCERYMFI